MNLVWKKVQTAKEVQFKMSRSYSITKIMSKVTFFGPDYSKKHQNVNCNANDDEKKLYFLVSYAHFKRQLDSCWFVLISKRDELKKRKNVHLYASTITSWAYPRSQSTILRTHWPEVLGIFQASHRAFQLV